MPTLTFTPATCRTRSPRRLAGTRVNKRRPVARQTVWTDLDEWSKDYLAGRLSAADAILLRRAETNARWPWHAARAVSIHACHGMRLPERNNPGQVAGSHGESAATMTMARRGEVYERGFTKLNRFTPAQSRRLLHKGRRSGELV